MKDPRPRFFVVWTSIYGTDNREFSDLGAEILADPRVRQYHESKPEVVASFGRIVPLPRDTPLAYDVYFLYDGKTEWKEAQPPKPHNWWHQIIDGPRFLDVAKLKVGIETLLPKS